MHPISSSIAWFPEVATQLPEPSDYARPHEKAFLAHKIAEKRGDKRLKMQRKENSQVKNSFVCYY